jgi:hypothetical protein
VCHGVCFLRSSLLTPPGWRGWQSEARGEPGGLAAAPAIGSMHGRLDLAAWHSPPCEGGLDGWAATGTAQPVTHPSLATEQTDGSNARSAKSAGAGDKVAP